MAVSESVQSLPRHTVAVTDTSPTAERKVWKCFAPVVRLAGEALVAVHVMLLNDPENEAVQSIWAPGPVPSHVHSTSTNGGGGPTGVGGTGVGVPGTGVAVGVAVAVVNLMTTEAEPLLQTVMLHAVISTVAVVFWVNVVLKAVEPGGTGAGRPFRLQRVVV
jgi:hypothetical protein